MMQLLLMIITNSNGIQNYAKNYSSNPARYKCGSLIKCESSDNNCIIYKKQKVIPYFLKSWIYTVN